MNKKYYVVLDGIKIGTTYLKKADPSMGVVFGAIEFTDSHFGYDFIKEYCEKNQIELTDNYPEDRLISTRTIAGLKVISETGVEIKGLGNQITGMDGEGFEVYIEGISYNFFELEFPHHIIKSNNLT